MMHVTSSRSTRRTLLIGCSLIITIAAVVALARPVYAQKNSRNSGAAQPSNSKQSVGAHADVQRFRSRVDAILNEMHARKSDWGLLVVDRDTGAALFELNADRFFTPASNAKLFTTVFALVNLGPGYHFRTILESNN